MMQRLALSDEQHEVKDDEEESQSISTFEDLTTLANLVRNIKTNVQSITLLLEAYDQFPFHPHINQFIFHKIHDYDDPALIKLCINKFQDSLALGELFVICINKNDFGFAEQILESVEYETLLIWEIDLAADDDMIHYRDVYHLNLATALFTLCRHLYETKKALNTAFLLKNFGIYCLIQIEIFNIDEIMISAKRDLASWGFELAQRTRDINRNLAISYLSTSIKALNDVEPQPKYFPWMRYKLLIELLYERLFTINGHKQYKRLFKTFYKILKTTGLILKNTKLPRHHRDDIYFWTGHASHFLALLTAKKNYYGNALCYFDLALTMLSKMKDNDPDDIAAVRQNYRECLINLATFYFRNEEYPKAISVISSELANPNSFLSDDKSKKLLTENIANYYFHFAISLQAKRDYLQSNLKLLKVLELCQIPFESAEKLTIDTRRVIAQNQQEIEKEMRPKPRSPVLPPRIGFYAPRREEKTSAPLPLRRGFKKT